MVAKQKQQKFFLGLDPNIVTRIDENVEKFQEKANNRMKKLQEHMQSLIDNLTLKSQVTLYESPIWSPKT